MSNAVFPIAINGLQPEIKRTPLFNNILLTSASGKEVRAALYSTPRKKFSISYGYLKDYDSGGNYFAGSDFRTLYGFYLARTGNLDSFYFPDPDDIIDNLPPGDGIVTAFAVQRNYNGYAEAPDMFQYLPIITQGVGGSMENLCPFSTQIDSSAWIKTGVTVTSNTIANPVNGAVDGDTLTPTTTTGTVEQFPLFALATGMPYERGVTLSFYFKAVTNNQTVKLFIFDSFDGTNNAGVTNCAITTAGWTRFTVSYTPTAAARAAGATIHLQIGGVGGYLTTATGAIYASCAQVERQLSASPWVTNGVGAATNSYVFSKIGSTWTATYSVAPPVGAMIVTDNGVPMTRVRFMQDNMDFDAFMDKLYKSQVDMIQVAA